VAARSAGGTAKIFILAMTAKKPVGYDSLMPLQAFLLSLYRSKKILERCFKVTRVGKARHISIGRARPKNLSSNFVTRRNF
jgi:hypothetical protein